MCTECLEPSRLVSITLIFVIVLFYFLKSLPGRSDSKESACNAGDLGLIPGMGRSPGGGHGNPLQYSCLENPVDRGAWRVTVRGETESQTRLNDRAQPHTSWAARLTRRFSVVNAELSVGIALVTPPP